MRRSDRSNSLKAVPMPQRHFFHGHRKGRLFPPGLSPPLAEGGKKSAILSKKTLRYPASWPYSKALSASLTRLCRSSCRLLQPKNTCRLQPITPSDAFCAERKSFSSVRPSASKIKRRATFVQAIRKRPSCFPEEDPFPGSVLLPATPSGQPNSSTQNRSSNTSPLAIGSLSCCSGEISPEGPALKWPAAKAPAVPEGISC